MAEWSVEQYQDARGKQPVADFLREQGAEVRAPLLRAIGLLRLYGVALGDPHARPISDKLWELRAGAGRIFYVALTGRRFTLLHAYIKKSRKAPEREIETARRRLADLLEREKQ
jgi:phage-related protein